MTCPRYDKYLTVKKDYEKIYSYIEKGSKFYCHIFRVRTKEDTIKSLEEIKSKYYDSSHNCFAYILKGDNIDIKGFSDDNEPSRTAGYPILEVIRKNQILDVMIIVTRYFGGTLLGANGLVKAYSKSASNGIRKATKVMAVYCKAINLEVEYSDFDQFENLVDKTRFMINEKDFKDKVYISGYVPIKEKDEILGFINEKMNGRVKFSEIDKDRYIDFQYKGGK